MGVWGSGSFGNDAALDFVSALNEFAMIRSTLSKFENNIGALDADDASVALAACDMLAVTIGRPPVDLPEDLPNFGKKTFLTAFSIPPERLSRACVLNQSWQSFGPKMMTLNGKWHWIICS